MHPRFRLKKYSRTRREAQRREETLLIVRRIERNGLLLKRSPLYGKSISTSELPRVRYTKKAVAKSNSLIILVTPMGFERMNPA